MVNMIVYDRMDACGATGIPVYFLLLTSCQVCCYQSMLLEHFSVDGVLCQAQKEYPIKPGGMSRLQWVHLK